MNIPDMVFAARKLRELLQSDSHRPRYHFVPPEGFFNDANGTLYWKGRYHIFYLARTPIPNPKQPDKEKWVEVWDHASSSDLLHWVFHRPALHPRKDGSTPEGIWSGDAVENAPLPTLIYHVPGQGTCIAMSEDDKLEYWQPLDENPIIPMQKASDEHVVFDPCAWREGDVYYALIGNKNNRPGYEGDSTSLFRSKDLRHWEYLGPFYKSERRWTGEIEDCACPDFFPLGDRHMLLMHGHRPYFMGHYYLGRYKGQTFYPEEHGRMNWPGGQLSAPETLLDKKGRRIFFGWIYEGIADHGSGQWSKSGWASVMSLPRALSLSPKGSLKIEPVKELAALRHNHRKRSDQVLEPGSDLDMPGVQGDCLNVMVTINPEGAKQVGVKLRCSPDGEEQTAITVDLEAQILRIELESSTLDKTIRYPRYGARDAEGLTEDEQFVTAQEAPFELQRGEPVELQIYLDRSVLEVFANGRQCMTQRIYPTRLDSLGVRLFARGGGAYVPSFSAWDMMPTNPW